MTGRVLSTRVLNRTLLARQHLLERTAMPALAMIEHLAGMQAQEPKDPYVALWSRIEGFQPAELEALLLDRRAVRAVLMRSTVHLASIDDALAFRPVVQPVLDGELFKNKTWSVGLEGVDLEPVLALGRRLLEERPRSLAELRVAMAERFPDRNPTNLAYACRGRLPTLQVPPRGLWSRSGQVKLTTLDHWSGRPLGTETAPGRDDPALPRRVRAGVDRRRRQLVAAHRAEGGDGAPAAPPRDLPRREGPGAVRPPRRPDRGPRRHRSGPVLSRLRQRLPGAPGSVARRARAHEGGARRERRSPSPRSRSMASGPGSGGRRASRGR